jgi:chemotaxis methyl-accepting protein methylase
LTASGRNIHRQSLSDEAKNADRASNCGSFAIGSFHLIFCRNVMLYFDEETRGRVVERLCRCLAPGGWLIMGQAEDSRAARNWLEPVGGSIYRKPRRQ